MIQFENRPRPSAPHALLGSLLGGILLVTSACHEKKPAETGAAAPTASATGSAGASGAAAGPCDQFITQLCGRSGEKSPLCGSGKEVARVLPASACLAAIKDFSQVEQQIDQSRKTCLDLSERLCKDLGPNTDTCALVREQTPQIPRESCEQMTQNYDQVLGELKQREAQNQPLTPEVQAQIAAKGAPSFGPENAKVTIVEFSDFQCPYCARASEVVHKIREQYADRVRFVFRQFPLPMHPDARLAAQAALEAQRQGKFWEFHDLLFAHQQELSREHLEDYAKQAKLNVAELKKALDGGAEKAAVDADVKLGEGVSVNGTPTVFINGKRVANPTDFTGVAKMIDEALGA
ncbi:MAG TPA: thioredoxin domain-containing protein [Polyangiaceae bacterium]|nr:thioredoxin domain-containing protein [Polyangiaceae bacterium]